ncbi:MAG: TRAP transporter substrate-binding protein [Alphaproteobacteria bacterium]|nr:TRAP transporter substrate-binding protein [Alphaproteobacteria bacterium]
MTFQWTLGAARGAVLAAAAAFSLGSVAQAQVKWDLPSVFPDGNFHVTNAKRFAEEVKKTGVDITIHPGGSLGFKGPDMLKTIRDGLVPIGDITFIYLGGEAPIFDLEAQPYLISTLDELQILWKHFRPVVDKIAEQWNQKILYVAPWPRQYVYTKTPMAKLEDLRGMKIRTYNKTTTDMFNRVGMSAVMLPWGEVVPALAAGTISSVTTSTSSGVDGKFWEFMKHMYPISHVWSHNATVVNLDAWKKLKPEQRAEIEAIGKRLQPEFLKVAIAEDETKAKMLVDKGVQLGPADPAIIQQMRELTKPMVLEFLNKHPVAMEVAQKFLAEVGRKL